MKDSRIQAIYQQLKQNEDKVETKVHVRPEMIIDFLQKMREVILPKDKHFKQIQYDDVAGIQQQVQRFMEWTTGDSAVSEEHSLLFIEQIPSLRERLQQDIQAAYIKDPAAKSTEEVAIAYPGIFAIMVHRISHEFYKLGYFLIARLFSEHAHSKTGIDIHPGAEIGHSFFIDHGTGIVVGETTKIGNNVTIYQGVTLGAFSFHHDENGEIIKGLKRHPTIEDEVTIYAGATILGGETTVGKGSIIGGNVWLTETVPENSKVISKFQVKVLSS